MVNLIVISSLAFLAVFFAVWVSKPAVRAWIEKPKYRFQANVESYDLEQRSLRAEEMPGSVAESTAESRAERDKRNG